MGGEEGLVGEAEVTSSHATGAQANGIVKPDEVESFVPQKHTEVPMLLVGGDPVLVE